MLESTIQKKNPKSESSDGFVPFVGDYEKRFYDVRRIKRRDKSGKVVEWEIIPHCWPNAGFLNETSGSQRSWSAETGVEFRPSKTHPLESSDGAKPLGFDQVSGDLPEELLTPVEDFGGIPEKPAVSAFRFGRLPDWKFAGWQFVLFFGSVTDPNVPAVLQLGWKTVILGAFKVAKLPEEGKEIGSDNVRGTILQFQVWIPFDRFGKL